MQNPVKQLDFSGQTIYIGIDVHKRQFVVTRLSETVEK